MVCRPTCAGSEHRPQRDALQDAYRETVLALACALESKDGATRARSERVRQYASELAKAVVDSLLEEPSPEYGDTLDVVTSGRPYRKAGRSC